MRTSLILLSLVAFSLCNLRTSTPEYDSLVLAIQWPNGVCAKQTSVCKQKLAKMKPNPLTVYPISPPPFNGL